MKLVANATANLIIEGLKSAAKEHLPAVLEKNQSNWDLMLETIRKARKETHQENMEASDRVLKPVIDYAEARQQEKRNQTNQQSIPILFGGRRNNGGRRYDECDDDT